jgi:hypothetical protein
MPTASPKPMSPSAALARHVEWLEYALAAARDEELRRQGRLDRATDKNRDKRAVRLAEVTSEVVELAALVKGIKDLQRPAPAARKARASKRSTPAASRRSAPAASASDATSAPATKKRTPSTAASKPASSRTSKPRRTAKSPAGSTTAPSGPTV